MQSREEVLKNYTRCSGRVCTECKGSCKYSVGRALDTDAMADRIRELEAPNTQKQQLRRSYRGVVYLDDHWESHNKRWSGTNVYEAVCYFFSNPSDEDFAGLLALRDNSTETLETVITRARDEWLNSDDTHDVTLPKYIAAAVETWMETHVAAEDPVAALLQAGWKELRGSDGLSEAFNELYKCSRILVLPSPTHNNARHLYDT